MLKNISAFGVVAIVLAGCAGSGEQWLREQTVGHVGCPEREIQIIDHGGSASANQTTWTVRCRGREYYCSLGGGQGHMWIRDNYQGTTCSPGESTWGEP